MTPDEQDAEPLDEPLLDRMMAFDALVHVEGTSGDRDRSEGLASTLDDERARDRLLLLLRMLDAAEATSDAPAGEESVPHRCGSDVPGPLLDRFDFLDDLGAGGFGFVIRARDRILGREVALKMPLPERLFAPEDLRRFLREARAAARLDHPSIVRVFDAGEIGPFGYFIASEYCEGSNLRCWMKRTSEPAPPHQAARWMAALSDAVQHAHDRGILHRDIKPDNIILATEGGSGEWLPRLTDFGLAKLVEEAAEDSRSEARVGTLAYMAPEQAAGRREEVGPAADIYALGATFYEILTGRPPFRGETEAQTLALILEADPVPPRTLRPGLPRDLETICLKCLRKEPSRRYGTAAGLRDDIRRFLEGRPIVGRPVSPAARAWRWARRRPAVAALLGLVVVLLGLLAGGFAWWVTWLERHHEELEIHVARADRSAEEARRQSEIAEQRRRLAVRHHYAESLRRARQALEAREFELAQDILHDLRPDASEADPRGFAWRHLWRQAHREFSQLWGHEATVRGWSATPDGKVLATWDLHGQVLIWDVVPGMPLDRPRVAVTEPMPDLVALRFSRDGRYLAVAQVPDSWPIIRIIDPATGGHVVRLELEGPGAIADIRFDDDGRLLAFVAERRDGTGELCWLDLAHPGARPHRRPIGALGGYARFSPDGHWLGIAPGGRLRLLDPRSGSVLRELASTLSEPCGIPEFSADGSFVAATTGRSILVWRTVTGQPVGQYNVDGGIRLFTLSARGSRLAVLDESGYASVFEGSPPHRRVLTSGPARQVRGQALSFSPDETLLTIGIETAPGGTHPPEVWDAAAGRRLGIFPGRPLSSTPSFFPGNRSLIVMGGTGPRIWRLDPPVEPDETDGHRSEAWAAAFTPDGRILATGSDDIGEARTIRLWEAATGRFLAGWRGHTATVASLAFSPDGRLLASGSLDSGRTGHPNVILWEAATHRILASLPGHTDRVRSVAFSPDSRILASASDDLTARLWEVEDRTSLGVLTGHTKNLTCLAFSPDGRILATASNDATVRLWDVETMKTRAILRDMGDVNALAFDPDGSMLATANLDGGIKLWDPATGVLLQTIRGEADQLRCLAFSPGGRCLAAAGRGRIVRLWDVETAQELLVLEGHKAQINALAFAPDGSTLASCSHDGAVRLWRAGPIAVIPPP